MDSVNESAFIHLHAYDAMRRYIDISCYDDLWLQVQRAMNFKNESLESVQHDLRYHNVFMRFSRRRMEQNGM